LKEMPSYQALMKKMHLYSEMEVQLTEANLHVLRAGTILKNRLERLLGGLHMSYGRFLVLGLLEMGGKPLPIGELADMAGVSTPTMSVVVNSMARDGLVERFTSSSDRRKVFISLSTLGENTIQEVGPLFTKWQCRSMENYNTQELQQLVELLSKLNLAV